MAEPDESSRSVSYRPGWLVRGANVRGRNLVPDWLREGYCSIALPDYPEVARGLAKTALAQVVREAEPGLSPSQEGARVSLLDQFLNRIGVGDLVVTVNDTRVYVGVVNGEPYWAEGTDAVCRRDVRWANRPPHLRRADLSVMAQDRLSGQATVANLGETAREFADLVESGAVLGLAELLAEDGEPEDRGPTKPPPVVVVAQPPLGDLPVPSGELAGRLFVDLAWLADTVDLLNEKKQLVLYGPPGTGKTYLAQEIADFLATETNGAHALVQFHPSYAYEDFVEGFRPALAADGTFRFAKEPGPLRRLVDTARENPAGAYVLVVDEINRANLAKVFGELYFLLEYRDRTIQLQYSVGEDFTLPPNVFLIGTMNTADRSIALVDAAMRRRFAWQSLFPGEPPVDGMLRRWLAHHRLPADRADLLDALNAEVGDRDAAVGPSYLMSQRVATDDGLARIWRTQILPLLEERHIGEHADVAGYVQGRYGLDALRKSTPARSPGRPGAATGSGGVFGGYEGQAGAPIQTGSVAARTAGHSEAITGSGGILGNPEDQTGPGIQGGQEVAGAQPARSAAAPTPASEGPAGGAGG